MLHCVDGYWINMQQVDSRTYVLVRDPEGVHVGCRNIETGYGAIPDAAGQWARTIDLANEMIDKHKTAHRQSSTPRIMTAQQKGNAVVRMLQRGVRPHEESMYRHMLDGPDRKLVMYYAMETIEAAQIRIPDFARFGLREFAQAHAEIKAGVGHQETLTFTP